jgi:hypothetical protein
MASFNPKPPTTFAEVRAIMQPPSEVEFPSPWTDQEFLEFSQQEPLPPNQPFQLSAEEPNQEELL